LILFAFIITLVFGFICGYVVCKAVSIDEPIGDLRVDESDPDDGPYLFLELKSRPESFKHLERVTLNVKAENYISQR
jgi:hypothetical protein